MEEFYILLLFYLNYYIYIAKLFSLLLLIVKKLTLGNMH